MTSSSPAAQRWDARLWTALFLLCGVLFLDGLDVSMVGVALPSIQADLGLTTSQLQWVISAYVLGLGGVLLLGGRAADLLGRRRVLIAALSVFTLASLMGGLVDSGALLIAARFLKGVAAAFTVPASLSLLTTTFTEGPARNKAMAIFNAFGASGFSFGLVFGGLLTEVGWRWTFLLPVPVAALLLFLMPRYIARDRPHIGQKRRYDLPGALLLTAGMLLLVRTIVEAPNAGWAAPETIAAFLLAAGLLAAFVAVERRAPQPLVRLGILRSAPLVRANLGAMCLFGAYVGFQFVATLYLQKTLQWSALETALAFLPAGLFVAVGAPRMGTVITRYGTAKPIVASTVAFAAGYALFLRVDATPYVLTFLPTIMLLGLGFALGYAALSVQATAGVSDHEQGLAAGLVQTSFQMGGAIVLAAVSAVVGQGTISDYRTAIAIVLGVAVLSLVLALTGVVRPRTDEVVATAS
ncbi:MFS transporter [Solirubrobacter ginsenosidimutans]|uniref:MFS transporter n=1 Tax=Solirubrobacter ginsenosidimutans TaxID=490573 RepID=A0A9X3MXM4_9ACTN|nr:MFS transporter [Solirubrobacter ginsenosidimutans]MDA0164650.1 MFS transporter [Solirubrobacter ginsenosidimutans]